jgi:tripeptidyl-peptidase-2
VDTTKKAAREKDGTVKGLSGRSLALGAWADGIDEFRVGATPLYSLLPSSVLERVARERKTTFEASQHVAVTAVQRDVDAFEADMALSASAKRVAKDDLELLLKQMHSMMGEYDDAGPLLDTVLYQGAGGDWHVVVDTTGSGDVSEATPMRPYRHARQVGDLGPYLLAYLLAHLLAYLLTLQLTY